MNRTYDINQPVKKVLIKAYCRENKNRNLLLFTSITLTIIILFCSISIIYGKLQIDTLNNIRSDGMTVSTYLENGTQNSLLQLKHLSYVKETGIEKKAGKLIKDQQTYSTCVMLDDNAYENIILPALVDVQGTYPQQANEIMLSTKTLNYLGIENYKLGMKISLDFYWNDIFCTTLTGTQDFILSGYYVDLQNTMTEYSASYISEKRLQDASIELFPCRILIDIDKPYLEGTQIESLLYKNLTLSYGQQIVSFNSASYRAIEGIIGGYSAAIIFCFVVLLVLFLFVYNILYISMDKDVRQYGLLKVLGTSNKQIKKIINAQLFQICFTGSILSIIFSNIIMGIIYPQVINKIYPDMNKKYVNNLFLILVCLIVSIIVFFASNISLKKMLKLSPIQAVKYENINTTLKANNKYKLRTYKKKSFGIPKKIEPIWQIAWGNITRSKKKFILTVFSLALGGELALASTVIANGTDLMNQLQKNPDFQISLTQEACKTLIETSQEISKMVMFNDSMITQITNTTNMDTDNILKTEGFFPIVNKQGNESLRILNLNQQNDPLIIIQKLNNNELEEFKTYITKNNITVDWDTFVQYNGVFILHNHLIPQYCNKMTTDYMGHNIGVYDLIPSGTDISNYTPFQLINCGYIDIADNNFPELNFLWNKENTIYFIVSNDTFNILSNHLTKQTFQISFHVQKSKEPEIKNKLKQWIQTTNMEFQSKGYSSKLNLLSIECNSDTIASNHNYIIITRFIMWTISIILIFIGIINYFNTMITDIIIRKREFTIMESIGLTKKQLRYMLTLEGFFYCFIIIGLWGTIGSGILYLIGLYMQSKLSYFIFRYPLELLITIIIALILICILIPYNVYKINKKQKNKQ